MSSGTHPTKKPRVLLIFLDGVGVGSIDPVVNPLFSGCMPFLRKLLGGRMPSARAASIAAADALCIPADANLRVAGLPQSGTGQATLYTGVNCARLIQQHFGPYLYSTLRPVVSARNVFTQLQQAGLRVNDCALANAFPSRFFDYLAGHRRRMVAGIYAAIESGVTLRDITHLKNRTAISTDITAARWPEIGHPDAPVVSHIEAGEILASVVGAHRFTLFEYFATDKAGHERSHEHAQQVLQGVDRFWRGCSTPSTIATRWCASPPTTATSRTFPQNPIRATACPSFFSGMRGRRLHHP